MAGNRSNAVIRSGEATKDNQVTLQSAASGVFAERHWTVAEVAKLWGVSKDTVRRLFAKEPGVLVSDATKGGLTSVVTPRYGFPNQWLNAYTVSAHLSVTI